MDEGRLLDEVANRRRQLGISYSMATPRMAGIATGLADAYPWMDPTAVQSFAQAGLSPDLPQVQSLADLAAQQAAEEGAFDTPAEDVPEAWYETLLNTATGWAKPFIRTGFTILATPMEELDALISSAGTALFDKSETGEAGLLSNPLDAAGAVASEFLRPDQLIRDFWENYTKKAARSTGVLALADLVQGKHIDLGEGYLPAGEIWEERQRAKHRLTLDGEFVTPGRIMARQFTEPGTTQYQILSGLYDTSKQIFLDPANIVTGGISKAKAASDAFQSVGLINGLRKTVEPQRAVRHYLTSDLGRKMIDWLTETDDIDTIWQAIGRADLKVAGDLAHASTTNETLHILSNTLGTVIREKPTAGFASRLVGGAGGNEYGALFGAGARARHSLANVRLGIDMPRSVLNAHNINDSARQLDLWMKNAKIGDDLRKLRITEMAGLDDGDAIGLFETAKRVMDDTKGILVQEAGITESRAKGLTRLYGNLADELHTFGVDAIGRHEDVFGPFRLVTGGNVDTIPQAAPLLATEMVNDIIPLPPTAREIRRLRPTIQVAQKVFDSGLWKGTIDGLDGVMSSVWKPLQLLRGAYTVRVIGEEQIRMSASGLDTLFTHPASAIAWTIGIDPSSRLGRRFANLAEQFVDPKGIKNVTGEVWDEMADYTAGLSRGAAGHTGFPGEILTGKYLKAQHGVDPNFYRGWAVEIEHMANDPIMRRLAGGLSDGDLRSIGGKSTGNVVDDVKEWFWSGSGQKFRKDWSRLHGRKALFSNQQVADDYIELFVNRLQRSTGGNSDLIEAIATRKLGDDINLRDFGHERKLAKVLEESYDSAAPAFTKVPELVRNSDKLAGLNRLVDMGFDTLMSKPTNWLSRSPTFRQKYWQRVKETIGFADEATQHAIIRAAGDANMGDDFLRELAGVVTSAGPGSRLNSLDEIDFLAKGFALDETRKLLYDLQKRSQFFDMARIIFPFGEAWKEIIGAWTSIMRKNPAAIRRFQQGLNGVRQPSVLGEAETTPGSGQGFFTKDPQTGEEVFTYPAGWVGKLLGVRDGGAGVSFVGRAAGLNIVSATVLPGFGPAIQYPASKIIPDTPKWDDLKNVFSPFGEQGLIESFTPAWMEKVGQGFFGDATDPENHRLFANTVADVQRHLLAANPKAYDISTVDGQQKLFDDAKNKAKWLYMIRGIAQSGVPTGPSLQWTTEDAEGNVVPVKILADELRRMTNDEYNGDRQAAFQEWAQRFGVENVLAIIGKSTAILERPVTEKGDAWLRAHQELERDYETVIGYFAPEPAVGEFNYDAYLRQFETGAREALDPAEQVSLANDFLGRIQWERAKQIGSFRPGPQTSAWLAQVREQIAEAHPGFDGWVSRRVWEQRPKVDEQITELQRAVREQELLRTDAGQGVAKYLSARQAAEQMVGILPGNVRRFQQAKSAVHIRTWLRSVAQQIREEHPDFARAWYSVFERELADDDELLLGGGISA